MTGEYKLSDLLQVSGLARSTYFYHLKRLNRPDPHLQLKTAIRDIFYRFKQRYGYRKVLLVLKREGFAVGKKLVRKLIRSMGLRSKLRKPSRYRSYQGRQGAVAKNVLQREFIAIAPNTKWVSDVSEIRTGSGKLYFSPVLDLYDHCIVSYTVSASPSVRFTAESLKKALDQERPNAGLIVHTDQGMHYQHGSWRDLLVGVGAVQSMSRKGNCYDNSVMENFFGHLKSEMFHGEVFADFASLESAIGEYVRWYNEVRVQGRLGGLALVEFRRGGRVGGAV